MFKIVITGVALATALAPSAQAKPRDVAAFQGASAKYERQDGLFPLLIDPRAGTVLAQLPRPDADGIMLRVIHHMLIRNGTGAGTTQMERGRIGPSRILRFRKVGTRVVAEYENPGFIGSGSAAEQKGVSESFPTSIAWSSDIISERSDGSLVVDLGGFLTVDGWGLLDRLNASGQGKFRPVPALSFANAGSAHAYPDDIEAEATFTFETDQAGSEMRAVTPDSHHVSIVLHHSFVRLPEPGYEPRPFDPRIGGFDTLITDFSTPLGQPLMKRLANRFRLEKLDPTAPRSRVKKPIVFYVDNSAPPQIQQALIEGAGWWKDAFEAAGFIDAFRVEVLPEGEDPLESRHNVILWSHRLTRGWSYGHTVIDPRTGEVLRGVVLLGSQRTRQNIIMFESLLGTANSGKGGPDDPVEIALARLRQLAAHETGHVLGFEHNFASHTQGRSSVSDYPAARISLQGDRFDMRDAYARGIGTWDKFSAYALYSQDDPDVRTRAVDEGLGHFVYRGHPDGRSSENLAPLAAPWVNGTDPVAELQHVMQIRRIALARFGMDNLPKGAPIHDLRRRLVPLYLYHRYQAEATARLIGGADYAYPLNGHGDEAHRIPVPAAQQKAAVNALLDTLKPAELLLTGQQRALLAAQTTGVADPQNDVELFSSRMARSFDEGAMQEAVADIVFGALLAPERLNALVDAAAHDPQPLGLEGVIDTILDRVLAVPAQGAAEEEAARRVQARAVLMLGRRVLGAPPPAIDGAVLVNPPAALAPTAAAIITARLAAMGARLKGRPVSDPVQKAFNAWLAELMTNPQALAAAVRDARFVVRIPPGAPI